MITPQDIKHALNTYHKTYEQGKPYIDSKEAASLAAALIIAEAIKESKNEEETG